MNYYTLKCFGWTLLAIKLIYLQDLEQQTQLVALHSKVIEFIAQQKSIERPNKAVTSQLPKFRKTYAMK